MSYILVSDFKHGLDTRRSAVTSLPGTLQQCTNAHITRGGEIEKRKAFVPTYVLPTGTFGLHSTGSALYVFGSIAAPTMPAGVSYQRLQNGTGANMTALLDSENYSGRIYAIATFDDGGTYHFWNGILITDWATIGATVASSNSLAAAFATIINLSDSYAASAAGAVITVTGSIGMKFTSVARAYDRGTNATQAITTTGSDTNLNTTGRVKTFTISGTFEPEDVFGIQLTNPDNGEVVRVVLRGQTGAAGRTIQTFGGKMYSTASSVLFFSEINGPKTWYSQANGAGFIDVSNEEGLADTLTGMAVYQGQLAVFSRNSVQTWQMDPDPIKNRKGQTLRNIGSVCPKSIVSFGDLDVFFLADSGIRSLRARSSTNAAYVSDIGTPIDSILSADYPTQTAAAARSASVGIIEPTEGRLWLAIGSVIYVFSYFPGAQIQAWSKYVPGFNVIELVQKDGAVFVRCDTDKIYQYGGADGATYDSCAVTVSLPFLDGGKPGHRKQLSGFDMTCDGVWKVSIGADVSSPTAYDECCTVTNSTWGGGRKEAQHLGSHFSVKFESAAAGAARIGNLALHFRLLDPE